MNVQPQTSLFTRVIDFLWDHKIRFLFCIAALFFAINGIAVAMQSFKSPQEPSADTLLPSSLPSVDATTTEVVSSKPTVQPIQKNTVAVINPVVQHNLPNRLVINRIGVDVRVANPLSTNINVLNDQLTRTVVRYQGSGTMNQGNILIMGHSSELPIIRNPLYKVFSQLKYLVAGDEIKVYSDTTTNTYRVRSVKMLSINNDEAYIPFTTGSHMLTLVTCNVRGAKDERYVVEADLIVGN